MSDFISLEEKFSLFNAHWTPKNLAQVNDSMIRIFKAKGKFVWHSHEHEDEFFLVVKRVLHIELEDKTMVLRPGEFFVVPKGVRHLPYAEEEAHVMLLEPKNVVNTGDQPGKKTVSDPDWI